MTNIQLSLFDDQKAIPKLDKSAIAEVPDELKSDTTNPNFFIIRGIIFKQKGFTTLAKTDLKKGFKLAPDNAVPAWHLAMIAYNEQRLHQAKYWLVKAIGNLTPASSNTRNRTNGQQSSTRKVFSFFIGIICIRLGDPDQATMHLQDAIQPGFEGSLVAIKKAIDLFNLGKSEAAIDFLKSELKRKDPETFELLQKMTLQKNTSKHSEKP